MNLDAWSGVGVWCGFGVGLEYRFFGFRFGFGLCGIGVILWFFVLGGVGVIGILGWVGC